MNVRMSALAASLLGACTLLATSVGAPSVALGASNSGSYSSGDLRLPIPDLGSVNSTISVQDVGTVSDVIVRVRLSHGSDRDLSMTLTGPDGTSATLAQTNGGDGRDFGSGAAGCSGA